MEGIWHCFTNIIPLWICWVFHIGVSWRVILVARLGPFSGYFRVKCAWAMCQIGCRCVKSVTPHLHGLLLSLKQMLMVPDGAYCLFGNFINQHGKQLEPCLLRIDTHIYIYYIILYHIILYYIISYHIILYYTILYYIIQIYQPQWALLSGLPWCIGHQGSIHRNSDKSIIIGHGKPQEQSIWRWCSTVSQVGL